jgi:hypothetical protein
MDLNLESPRAITPEKAIRLLQKQDIKITPENAALVVNFMYLLAEIFYNQQPEL